MNRSAHEILHLLMDAGWRRRYLILIPIVVLPFFGLLASRFAPKTYEARMTILVQEPGRLNPFLNDLSVGTNVKDRIAALNALLHSEHIIGKVLADINLIDAQTTASDRSALVRDYSSRLTLQLIGSELVELRIRAPRAGSLKATLEAVGKRLIERLVSPEQEAVASSENFLSSQLGDRRKELSQAEDALAEFQMRNAEKMPAMYTANVTRLGTLQQRLQEKSMELAAAEALVSESSERLASTNPIIGRMEEKIIELTSELATLRARYTNEHSDVQGAERRLNRLQEERRAMLAAAKGDAGTDMNKLWNMAAGKAAIVGKEPPSLLVSQMQRVQEMESRRTSLKQEVEQLRLAVAETQRAIADFAPIEQQQKRLERAVATAREFYDSLTKRYEMARVVGALGRYEAPERIKIIDPPVDPTNPLSPPRIFFVLFGLIGGIALGIGLAAVAEVLDPRIRRAGDIASAAGVPLIAVLDMISSRGEEQRPATHVPT